MVIWMGLVVGALVLVGVRHVPRPSSGVTDAWRCCFSPRRFSWIVALLFWRRGEVWHSCRIFHIGMI